MHKDHSSKDYILTHLVLKTVNRNSIVREASNLPLGYLARDILLINLVRRWRSLEKSLRS